jgi:hypothetical protein
MAVVLSLVAGSPLSAWGQNGTNPLNLFQNYFVTGDYVVAGWIKGAPDGSGYAPGAISVPDTLQPTQNGVPASVPKGADIVASYLYWATVEGNQSAYTGQTAYFNGYAISGIVLGNPNAPTSWSAGGCSGSSKGSKTMRTYRADVHPFLPVDTNPASPTFGATIANGRIPVRLADSGSNGNAAPIALGATLVIIYRVLSPAVPLNAIVLYDGAYAPSNAGTNMSQTLAGFYEPASSPVAKITHIVANGQTNKGELVYLNNASQPLPSLYGGTSPFPGIYGSWDNPTWPLNGYVKPTDTSETTSVIPTANNSGCVSWGAIVMSTSVQDTDGDGLLDEWETNQGYTDATTGQWVALPGANPNGKDVFVELDYLNNMDGSAGPYLHSHLPKQAALDAAGTAFANQNIQVHFDLGPGIYQGDPYVISYPVSTPSPLPAGTLAPQAGSGGNSISEGQVLCNDGATLCAYPGQPAVGWKGGFEYIKNSTTLGNFQPGRATSYHYVLFGHSLGEPRAYWSTTASALAIPVLPQLISIVNSGNTATITIQSPQGMIKPGDCPNAALVACGDASSARVSVIGALNQTALNGTYSFSNAISTLANNVYKTTFTIPTAGVANGTYNFASEPQLAVTYLGPVSSSGQAELGGGGDSAVTLGLWGADDPPGCEPDPSQPLTSGQDYCSNEDGTVAEQTGTLLHELGHSLGLTHGGKYYLDPNNPSLPTYELNCKPNFLSVMNYMFQVRGFVDGGFDYSSQTLPPLNESSPYLSESSGLGNDTITGQAAAHLTRWYAPPNTLDIQLGNKVAQSHCDGTPLGPNDIQEIRVDGFETPGGTYSAPLDFNHDLIVPDQILPPGIDLNYNGMTGDAPFSGFNDWEALNLQQIGARENAFGYSGSGVKFEGGGVKFEGGGVKFEGGGVDNDGGGVKFEGGGVKFEGGGVKFEGGGVNFEGLGEQSEDVANTTADPPTALTCSVQVSGVGGCTGSSAPFTETGTKVPLSWTAPGFGQTRSYTIARATGSYTASQLGSLNPSPFTVIATLTGAPPAANYIDTGVTTNTTYTYVVTDSNKQGATSGPSNLLVVTVTKAIATVTLGSLNQTYTGSPLSVTATTVPAGLTVNFTYNGSATPPTAAGTYAIVGTVNDPNYQGTATGTLTIAQATPIVSAWPTAGAITSGQTLASSKLTGGIASVPGSFAFTSPTTAPSPGTTMQSVTFTPTDLTDYSSVTGTVNVTVSKATASVTLGSLNQTYTGSPVSATATTNPAGLTVNFTYNGSVTSPTAAGTYTVVGTINDPNYQGSATGTLTIAKATPIVSAWPTASNLIHGQTLAKSNLTGGTASVLGKFAWTTTGLVPPMGISAQSVTFTPTDSIDYKPVVGTVKITVTDRDGDFDDD